MKKLGILMVSISSMVLIGGGAAAMAACTFTTIGTTMYLDADCITTSTISIPDGFTLDGQGFKITASDPDGGFIGAVVKNGGNTANVINLKIVGNLGAFCKSGDNRLRGIFFDGANGSITRNDVSGMRRGPSSGCQEGNGIEVRNTPFDGTHPNTKSVVISENYVEIYQKNGITANGDVAATITDNTVIGVGPVNYIAQNGIQFGYGAMGMAMRNTIKADWYSGANWAATGLLIFEAGDITAHKNMIEDNQVGVGIETWCWSAPSASDNRIMGNTIEGCEYGVSVAAYAWAGSYSAYTHCNPSADNNKVVNNTIITIDGDTGIFVGSADLYGDSTYIPSAVNNKVITNKISGYAYPIDITGATASKVHANKIPSEP